MIIAIIGLGLLYKNGQNHEIFIFVYSKLLLNSPFNEFPLIYRPKWVEGPFHGDVCDQNLRIFHF